MGALCSFFFHLFLSLFILFSVSSGYGGGDGGFITLHNWTGIFFLFSCFVLLEMDPIYKCTHSFLPRYFTEDLFHLGYCKLK